MYMMLLYVFVLVLAALPDSTWYSFFCYCTDDHRDLHVPTHSFPTRRSSDLASVPLPTMLPSGSPSGFLIRWSWVSSPSSPVFSPTTSTGADSTRSEEHTSELQSLMRFSYSDFCLKTKNIAFYFHSAVKRPYSLAA